MPDNLENRSTQVHVVEIRSLRVSPAPHESSVESDLMFIGSDREKALEYLTTHPNPSQSDYPWCWYVYGHELDNPMSRAIDAAVYGWDRTRFSSQGNAWKAFVPPDERSEAKPPGIRA